MSWLWSAGSFWAKVTLIVGAIVAGRYVYHSARGTLPGSAEQRTLPPEVRAAPGGYRSFHFWYAGHGGYRGGK